MSSRAVTALGLGLLAVTGLTQTVAQQTPGAPAATAPTAGATRQASPTALRIGSIDMEQVFKEYKKVEATSNQLRADATAKQAELHKVLREMQQLGEEMKGLPPGSNDFNAREAQITSKRAQLEAEREQAQTDFARREAQALAQIYREVQDMSAAFAKANGMQFVVKVSNEPVSGSDPNSVMAAMARSVIYSDPSLDITSAVIKYLNQRYEQAGGTTGAPTDAATQPASATAGPAAAPRGQ